MADSFVGIKIKDLPEAQQGNLTDNSVAIVDDGATTRKTKLSTFADWLNSKLGISKIKEDINSLNSTLKRERFSISPTSSEVSVKVRFSSKFNKVPTVVVTPTFQGWRLSKPIQVSDITTDGFTATAWIENGATSSDTWITVEYVAVAT